MERDGPTCAGEQASTDKHHDYEYRETKQPLHDMNDGFKLPVTSQKLRSRARHYHAEPLNGPVVLVVGGGPEAPTGWPPERPWDLIIGADRGAQYALEAGLTVDLVVGDLDSIDAAALSELRKTGSKVEVHDPRKDHSDLDLALRQAIAASPSELHVVASGKGRLDHTLIIMTMFGRADIASQPLTAWVDDAVVIPIAAMTEIDGQPGHALSRFLPASAGDTVSLLALGGDATVTTHDLDWNLDRSVLAGGTSLGLSNIATADNPVVTTHRGVVLAMVTPAAVSLNPTT